MENRFHEHIGKLVSIKNPADDREVGYGTVLDGFLPNTNNLLVGFAFGHVGEFNIDRLIFAPSKDEVIKKLEDRLHDWFVQLPGCTKKDCFSCKSNKKELNEALDLLKLLKEL